MSATTILKSLAGRMLGISALGNLVSNGIAITRPCVDASIVIGDQATHTRTITIQLKDAKGNDINYVETFEMFVFANAAMTAFAATGGSTGVAVGTDGALLATVAKKRFICTSEADGDWDGTWVDDADETAYLAIRLPNGRMIVSSALTNA